MIAALKHVEVAARLKAWRERDGARQTYSVRVKTKYARWT